jgi:serine protease Do
VRIAQICCLFLIVAPALAETVKDREGAVRQDKAAFANDPRWAYNDIDSGFKRASATGKPLLIVMRCVPCLSCMGIDTAVLLQDKELAPLLDQFVCVRVINANALDLTRFQFDFDLSFSTLFFNGDGTVYGRFGSWTHQKNSQDSTTAGYRRALEAALAIHRGYPANKAELAGKQPGPFPFVTPTDMPLLAGKYRRELDWDGKVMQSCIHCHMIGDAVRASYRDQKQPVPLPWIYPMPAPETIGLTLAPDQIATVAAVSEGSAAATAGVRAGDAIAAVNGQPLVSIADFAWALHRMDDSGDLDLHLQRPGGEASAKIHLPAGWRYKVDNSSRAAAWPMRGMATGGMVLVDLSDAERKERGLAKEQMALFIKSVGQYGKHAAAKKAGFQKEDVLVEIAGMKQRMTESELLGHLLREQMLGQQVPAAVIRGGSRVDLTLPMQ